MRTTHTAAAIIAILCCTTSSNAQGEGWNWYFGGYAGLNFSGGDPIPLLNSALSSYEGTSTISDSMGTLLFYTNGLEVADASHQIMPNGFGLFGDSSSAQGAIIVQQPMSDSLYYIFNVDFNQSGNGPSGNGFTYSVVDMSLNGGLGDVTLKNIPVRGSVRERITAVRHANGDDYWIVIIDWADDEIYAYLFDQSGLDTTPAISSAGPFHNNDWINTTAYLKASRQNDKLATTTWDYNRIRVMDFDNATGLATNRDTIQGTTSTMLKTYGAEFSPDGSKLYGTNMGSPHHVYQFDLTLADSIYENRVLLATHTGTGYYYGALQIGPDGKIYCAINGSDSIGVINHPDSAGLLCDFVENAVPLGGRVCRLGLPNFVSDIVKPVATGLQVSEAPPSLWTYPNPCDGLLSVRLPNGGIPEMVRIVISDQLSRVVQSSTAYGSGSVQVPTSHLPPGIYLMHLSIGSRTSAGTFVVSR